MAATEATRRTRRITTSDRRGAHAPSSARHEGDASEARSVTPAFHITPNVVITARGSVYSTRRERRGTSQRSLRRFAV